MHGDGMTKALGFINVPAEFTGCSGSVNSNADGTSTVSIRFEPCGGSQVKMATETDVVMILDARFSMYPSFFLNGQVLDYVDAVAAFAMDYDDDVADVYLHSLHDKPFRHLGAFQGAAQISETPGEYLEPGSAMKAMGQKTTCTPAIRNAVRRPRDEKRSKRPFVEATTDGSFDDKQDLEAVIVDTGRLYNSRENPLGCRGHLSGIGSGGAQGIAFLRQLDDGLADQYSSYIYCVDCDASLNVEENVASNVKELAHVVTLEADNVLLEGAGGEGCELTYIRTGVVDDWEGGGAKSVERLPVVITVHVNVVESPRAFQVRNMYGYPKSGDLRESKLVAVTT